MSCDQNNDAISFILMMQQNKTLLLDSWSMFSNNFKQSTAKIGKYIKKAASKLFITLNRLKKLVLVCFLTQLLLRQMVEKLHILFGPHCNISNYA